MKTTLQTIVARGISETPKYFQVIKVVGVVLASIGGSLQLMPIHSDKVKAIGIAVASIGGGMAFVAGQVVKDPAVLAAIKEQQPKAE